MLAFKRVQQACTKLSKQPKWEDFNYTYMDRQDGPERFLYFGNGHSHYDLSDDQAPCSFRLACYHFD
jgi:hypothetical protein